MAKKKSGINVQEMIPEAGDGAAESGPLPGSSEEDHMEFLEAQASLPGVDSAVEASLDKKAPKAAPVVQGKGASSGKDETTTDPKEMKEEPTPKRKSWGEVMILEKMNIPVSSDGKEKMEGYIPVKEFDLETGSTVDAEKWLTDCAENDSIPFGTYTIMRKVKTIRLKEIRQVLIEEVDE